MFVYLFIQDVQPAIFTNGNGADMEPNIYFNPVSKKRVSEVVYEQIFEKISNKELKQGDRLPSERELAAQFNCGRPSVREALRMLQQDDLIEIDVGANGGAIIKHSIMESAIYPVLRLVGTGDISISDMIQYRRYNDTACLMMAIDNATDNDIKKMQQIMFDYEKHLNNQTKIHKIDKSFHNALAEASHNNMCLLVSKIITSLSTDLFYNIAEQKDADEVNMHNKLAFENHSRMLQCIIDKDKDSVEEIAIGAAELLRKVIYHFNTID